ncbi:hypothetical protein JCM13664_16330 [Methylothermus subterraneus]
MAHEHAKMAETAKPSQMGMTMGGMGEMMEMCSSMMGMEMGPMMMGNSANPMKPAAAIAVVTASANPGKSLLKRLARNPWVWFGLGVAAGILIHRYRKEIIATAVKVGEKGKDFILQQKESLEDIVAETQEK